MKILEDDGASAGPSSVISQFQTLSSNGHERPDTLHRQDVLDTRQHLPIEGHIRPPARAADPTMPPGRRSTVAEPVEVL